MDAPTQEITIDLTSDEALTDDQFEELVNTVRSSERDRINFEQELTEQIAKNKLQLEKDPAKAGKAAQAYFALGDYAQAVDWLDKAVPGKVQCYLKGCCRLKLDQYDQAVEAFEQAEEKGCESFDVAMAIIDCLTQKGDLEEAEARLKRVSRIGDIRAEYHFQLGKLLNAQANREEAMAEYERAIALDPNHKYALFALAFACDLYGDEKQAIEYYQRCVSGGTAHVSALLNLAVLYEEAEKYTEAFECARRVVTSYPNHQRARLFLKDIESSVTMYYDEDQERRVDRRNQVLQIPISDFELSVRSRNCLRKMNIRNLGDLLRVTEAELLAYKNFGETSLLEIKAILNQKGLRLGQMLEDRNNLSLPTQSDSDEQAEPAEDDMSALSVSELELSVRARKALQRLNLNTIGELTRCTEAELLGCKNFGMTSLQEIKLRLKVKDLSLRQLEE